ncbi:MAG: PHP domain-containing protein, partial [Nitriliruptoraceae bacterium]
MSGYDLHTHSTFSDGVTTIEHNLEVAARLGLEGLGITDHDTTEPFALAVEVAGRLGLDVLLGTELSAEEHGVSVHVLGYGVDPDDAALAAELERLRHERVDRARAMVAKLEALGVPVRFERVEALAGDAPIGRPHVAAAVVEAGAAGSLQEVFDRYLADGGPAFVPKHALPPRLPWRWSSRPAGSRCWPIRGCTASAMGARGSRSSSSSGWSAPAWPGSR